MSKKKEPFIQNKPLFITACVLLIFTMILDAAGFLPNNQYLDALVEVSALLCIISMYYLAIRHDIIINVMYFFAVLVCCVLIIIACISLF